MSTSAPCTTCGRPTARDDLGGLCASCLLGWATAQDGGVPFLTLRGPPTLLNIPGYEVREEIARGGMGIVYRARQQDPRREVALKMLLPHQVAAPGMLGRFRLEAHAIATLEHPAILPVHHVGEFNGLPFFTMKLASGGSLAQRKTEFAGNWRRMAQLLATLADAVQFAHERGVLHRDLKPGNVLFDEADRAYVSDFGLAKLADGEAGLTRSVELLGTPQYVAPEVAARSAKEATTASDIYSLGAILYELLAGRPPFEADGLPALLKKIAEEDPVRPRLIDAGRSWGLGVGTRARTARVNRGRAGTTVSRPIPPRDLEVICLKCLAKNPARRYATARELGNDLRRWLEGRPILARPASLPERVHSWTCRNPALALMATALGLVLVTALVLQARSNRRLQLSLAESLLRQAQLERSSGQAGQRFETLALLERAAEQFRSPGTRLSRAHLVSLRSERAAALALPDLRLTDRWQAHVGHWQTEFDFTEDLERYIAPRPDGGFEVVSAASQQPIHRVTGTTNNPAIKLGIHPGGRWVAARFLDGHAELHSLDSTFLAAVPMASATNSSVAFPRDTSAVRRWPGVPNTSVLFEFDHSGNLFAVVTVGHGSQRVAEVIDLNTGATKAQVPAENVTSLAFNPPGTCLALAGAEVEVWHLADTNKLWSVPLSHEASAMAWSPEENRLAVAVDRRRPAAQNELLKACPVMIFDATKGTVESIFGQFNSRVARMAFHPRREWLALVTWEDGLVLGSTKWESLRLFSDGAHRALRFSRDGARLGYAPTREELGISEVAIPSAFRAWRSNSKTEEAFTLTISNDGKWAVTTSATMVHLWDTTARVVIDSRPLPAKAIWVEALFELSSECVFVSAASFGVLRVALTNGVDGQPRFGDERIIGEDNGFLTSGFAHDGRSLVVGDHRAGGIGPTMWLWPDADPKRARRLAWGFPLTGYRVVPHSRWAITTALVERDVWIWDFETGERLHNLGLEGRASSEPLANGRWLVARNLREFGVWEVGTWNRVARWPARPEEASMTLFSSPDSRLLATYNVQGQFMLRELPNGHEVLLLPPPYAIPIQHFQFTPDSTRLLFVGNSGQMFDWDLGEIRLELEKLKLEW